MEKDSERLTQEIYALSKKVFISLFVLAASAFVCIMVDINWLSSIVYMLFLFMVFVFWSTPGIFILFRRPWFAQAWLRGFSPFDKSNIPWNGLSGLKKFSVYLTATLFSIVAIFGVLPSILDIFKK